MTSRNWKRTASLLLAAMMTAGTAGSLPTGAADSTVQKYEFEDGTTNGGKIFTEM